MILDALLPLVAGALVFATNFALVVGLTAVGASVTERAGVLNLGHEGSCCWARPPDSSPRIR